MAFNIHDLSTILNQLKGRLELDKKVDQIKVDVPVKVDIPVSETVEKPKRCQATNCKTKLVLSDFPCQCKKYYCSSHRHAENHLCSFDYRQAGANSLGKNLVKVVADKMERI
jgi:hypothetical protein